MQPETNKLKRAWIWLWYNDAIRLCVLGGLTTLPVVTVAYYFGLRGESLRFVAVASYVMQFGLALLDNDYSNLRRIGLNEYRTKLSAPAQEGE